MDHQMNLGMSCEATIQRAAGLLLEIQVPKVKYDVECFDERGWLKWHAHAYNLVTNQGIQDILEKYFRGSAYTAAWYIGLVTGPSPTFANADTAASHAGWTEFTTYAEAARQALVLPAFSGTSGDNSASKGTFTCNNGSNAVVSGLFLATASAKSATTGVLYSEAAFTQGDKTVSSGDVLAVTATLSGVTQ